MSCYICKEEHQGCLGETLASCGLQIGPHPTSTSSLRSEFIQVIQRSFGTADGAIEQALQSSPRLSHLLFAEFGESVEMSKLAGCTSIQNPDANPCLEWLGILSKAFDVELLVICSKGSYTFLCSGHKLFKIRPPMASRTVVVGCGYVNRWHEIHNPSPDSPVWTVLSDAPAPTYSTEGAPVYFENDPTGNQIRTTLPSISIQQLLLSPRLFAGNPQSSWELSAAAYRPSEYLDMPLSSQTTIQGLEAEGLQLGIAKSIDIDAILAYFKPKKLGDVLKSGIGIAYEFIEPDKRVLKETSLLLRDCWSPERIINMKMLKIGSVRNNFAKNVELILIISTDDQNWKSKLGEAVHGALEFACSEIPGHNCPARMEILQNQSGRLAKRTALGRKRGRAPNYTLEDSLGYNILGCFGLCLDFNLNEVIDSDALLFYRSLNTKFNLVVPETSSVGEIESLLRSCMSLEECESVFVDLNFGFVPHVLNSSRKIVALWDKDELKKMISHRTRYTEYPQFLTHSIGSVQSNDGWSGIFKSLIYNQAKDVLSGPTSKGPITFQNHAGCLLGVFLDDQCAKSQLPKMIEAVLRENDDLFGKLDFLATDIGVRAEFRVDIRRLTSFVNILDSILSMQKVKKSLVFLELETFRNWIKYLHTICSQPILQAIGAGMNAYGRRDWVAAMKACTTISIFESLRCSTIWNGLRYSFASEIVWNQVDGSMKLGDRIESLNQPYFDEDVLTVINGNLGMVECEERVLLQICERILGYGSDDPSSTAALNFRFRYHVSTLPETRQMAHCIWKEYFSYLHQLLSLDGNRWPIDFARNLNSGKLEISESSEDIGAVIRKLFNPGKLKHRAWNISFLHGFDEMLCFLYQEAKSSGAGRLSYEVILQVGWKLMAEMAVELSLKYLHYIGNDPTRLFGSAKRFSCFRTSEIPRNVIEAGRGFCAAINASPSRIPWSRHEEDLLIIGLNRYASSRCRWKQISSDAELGFNIGTKIRSNVNIKDKFRTLLENGQIVQDETTKIWSRHELPTSNERPIVFVPPAENQEAVYDLDDLLPLEVVNFETRLPDRNQVTGSLNTEFENRDRHIDSRVSTEESLRTRLRQLDEIPGNLVGRIAEILWRKRGQFSFDRMRLEITAAQRPSFANWRSIRLLLVETGVLVSGTRNGQHMLSRIE